MPFEAFGCGDGNRKNKPRNMIQSLGLPYALAERVHGRNDGTGTWTFRVVAIACVVHHAAPAAPASPWSGRPKWPDCAGEAGSCCRSRRAGPDSLAGTV